ncbi:MAG: hypothetical protein ABSH53_18675 [Holophaga sp.]|jgi:hypothetical protein
MDKLKGQKGIWMAMAAFVLFAVMAGLMKLGVQPESRKWYGILFASDYFPLLSGIPAAADADEQNLIYENLIAVYPFKRSNLHPQNHNIYCAAGGLHTLVTVYEVVDPAEQDKIIQAARDIRRKFRARTFSIEFYAKETGLLPRDQFLRKVRIN